MAKVKVEVLTGKALDWLIATLQGEPVVLDPMGFKTGSEAGYWIWDDEISVYMLIGRNYSPSSNWSQGGNIMEQYGIFPSVYGGCGENSDQKYQAGTGLNWYRGETPLIAVMRSVVSTVLGKEVDVPSILLN